ncbi:hypothetical protein BHE74_00029160 [Ensete ventricosum]|nr:hypothetical protein BHE74_00029160 [Ensete ventricosum]RZR76884.1 hypothetical protein BHM03_00001784 [Ensete ventricosum]
MATSSVLVFFLSLLLLATAGISAGAPRKRVGIYELRRGEFSVKVTNWGATITSVVLPDSQGKLDDIALGYDGIRPYTVRNRDPLRMHPFLVLVKRINEF